MLEFYKGRAAGIAKRMAEDAQKLYEVALEMYGEDVITNDQRKRADQIAAAILTELHDFGNEVLGTSGRRGRR